MAEATAPVVSQATKTQIELAQLAITLANDDQIGHAVKKRISELNPSRRFPEVDAAEIRAEVKKEFETRDLETQKNRALAEQKQQRQSLLDGGRFKEDDVKEIEKLMEKEGISNYHTAAKIYAADLKPASPTHEIQSKVWTMPTLTKENFNNLAQHSRSEAYKAIDEIQRKRA